ncbi:phosphate acyltransferase PlsX [Geothermobacter ehrlichii]|uniref:phosphate acyltransferase PlsX n=1 Tax=Geothermobacter ehrlichii TaxID=213224 RepID=UPI0011E7F902
MTVAVDVMGGDNAPAVEVAGAVAACRRWGIPVVLVGDSDRIAQELSSHATDGLSITIQHASEVVGMHDSASDAIRKKKDSSIRVAFELVKRGEAQAVVSAGNSGATMAAGMFILKRIPGIERPAIAAIMPNLVNETMVLDAGGNVDCRPRHLSRFALMGAVYSKLVLGKEDPRVGLLSNGEEESKGNELTREAHTLLTRSDINYVGYVEGRDIYNGSVDVVVCDGFVGNVVLKTSEGLAEALATMLRQEMSGSLLAKLGYLLARPAFRRFRKKIDYAEYGGAPLLGVAGTGMICHGGSNEKAIMNAVKLAADYVEKNVNQTLEEALSVVTASEQSAMDDGQPAINGA